MSLKKNQRVKITEGMTGRIVGSRSLVPVRPDKHSKLRYYYFPGELEIE